ncbi:GNAT family N-acetyltransferase [Candidatus Chloroploca sp. M-50]|uniref:GNAT family N-acetyltransferase n=1 Tax=Candidatus Chloroploca mongolica TaxID=2528176 RepID=A0ABS4DH40_9CHLR|nr:GNAT family protein [Candidatus Chloroploca mongolica]MBP1468769.1 GNAT family N-acetyltransferase [Candidatus Chloroploca mongolica]
MEAQTLPRVFLRPPTPTDEAALLHVNQASIGHHTPWIFPPTTAEQFSAYLDRCAQADTWSRLVCQREDGAVMGAITLSQIFYGPLQSAYVGYYIGAAYARQGFMREAIALALDAAFGPLQLHRIEANIQPGNHASRALVQRLGFTREGYSRRYLFIAGEWRDHERYAMLAEDWTDHALG